MASDLMIRKNRAVRTIDSLWKVITHQVFALSTLAYNGNSAFWCFFNEVLFHLENNRIGFPVFRKSIRNMSCSIVSSEAMKRFLQSSKNCPHIFTVERPLVFWSIILTILSALRNFINYFSCMICGYIIDANQLQICE